MVRERIGSAKDVAENAVIETTARAMAQGTLAVRRLTAKRYGKIIMTVACMAVMMGAMAIVAAAAGGGDSSADGIFSNIETIIKSWVGKIGGLVILFGGIGAGLGIANQDEAGRNRGFMTMAGGAVLVAIVAAVGAASGGGA